MAKVIEFEGIDGSGKTTAYNYFIGLLREKGLKVLDTREVGNPHIPVCVSLRKTILDPNSGMQGMSMELVFAAMRIENQAFYEKVGKDYDVIVSDRGWLSHLAYTDHNVNEAFTKDFYMDFLSKYTKGPDIVAFLSLEPEVALKRRNSRNGFVDAIEAKGPQFQEKVYSSFVKYLTQLGYSEGSSLFTVDASTDIAGVQKQLKNLSTRF